MKNKKPPVESEIIVIKPQETEHTPSAMELARRKPLYRAKLDEQSINSIKEQMEAYFLLKAEDKKPPTLIGLANYLGVSKKTMRDYADRNNSFRKLYVMARQTCEEAIVEGVLTQKLNVVGGIFILKNHFDDYTDKREVETSAVFINADAIEEFKKRKALLQNTQTEDSA